MTLKFRKSAGLLTAVLLLAFFLTGTTVAQAAAGGTGYQNGGESDGLTVAPAVPPAAIDNLNPGDAKYSSLRLSNTGKYTLRISVRTVVDGALSPNGGALADAARLTIKDGASFLTREQTFRSAGNAGSIPVGILAPGGAKTLNFYVDFPGAAGNAWQGSSMQVTWVFTAAYTDAPPPDGGGGGGGGNTALSVPAESIGTESTPLAGPSSGTSLQQASGTSSEESVPDEDVPLSPPPKTGQDMMFPIIICAGAAVSLLVFLIAKRKAE